MRRRALQRLRVLDQAVLRLASLEARRKVWVWHHPGIVYATVASLSLIAVSGRIESAGAINRAVAVWGEPVVALVATDDIAIGDDFTGRWQKRSLPAPAVPGAAIVDAGRLEVARSTSRATAGSVITEAHLSTSVPIPEGWLGVPVPRRGMRAGSGDPVTVALDGRLVADRAVVVAVDDDTVTVAMPSGVATVVSSRPEDAVVLLAPSAP